MPISVIKVNTQTVGATQAAALLNFKNNLNAAIRQGEQLLGIMGNSNDGSTWTTLEGLFGLDPGKGQAVFDLVNGSMGALGGTMQNANPTNITTILV